jgi:hypothetical protein
MCVGYARLDIAEEIPIFLTLEEWEMKKSTKFDVCARMCNHLLSRDDAPEIYVKDGVAVFPPIPDALLEAPISQQLKLIIYQEFPSLGKLLRNVIIS